MTEHIEQSRFILWKRRKGMTDWRYNLIYAIPNGAKRHPALANYLKQEGLENGAPDVCFPYPSGKFPGLYIEMKYGENGLDKLQKVWRDRLIKAGYLHFVCYSCREAIAVVISYLHLGKFQQIKTRSKTVQD